MPLGIPVWMHAGASAAALVILGATLVLDGGTLPLLVQLACAAVAFVPWAPGVRIKSTSLAFVLLTFVPVAILAFTGAYGVVFGLLALATARVAVFGSMVASAVFAVASIGLILTRAALVDSSNWFVWKSYVELGLALGWAQRAQRWLVLRTEENGLERARLAAIEERRRIARDIHDTLAHSLTVMMVHLNSARLELADDPESVRVTLDEMAMIGRHSLEEVRRSVGLLSEEPGAHEPSDPTSASQAVEELVETFRRAGVDVDLRVDLEMEHVGLLATAPTRVWGTAYRVIQESLANAVKHAPGVPVSIGVDIDDAGVHIEVTNPLSDRVIALEMPSGGHGLRGMRERAALLNGTITAGAVGNRWVVRADVPLSPNALESRRTPSLGKVS